MLPPGYAIRPGEDRDVPALPAVERAAAAAFAPWGLDALFASATTPEPVLREAVLEGRLRVADLAGAPVGFALLSRVDWHAHLDELDVHPAHGRRGLGRALVLASLAWAQQAGMARLTLATMRDVPFNAPWYARLGFRELEERELGPGLRAVHQRELAGGFPVEARVFMTRELARSPRLTQGTNL
jgi:GNAT superfamily N-acetyltransferase